MVVDDGAGGARTAGDALATDQVVLHHLGRATIHAQVVVAEQRKEDAFGQAGRRGRRAGGQRLHLLVRADV